MEPESLRWQTAVIGWRPEGHVLEVRHNMSDRVTMLMHNRVQAWLGDRDPAGTVDSKAAKPDVHGRRTMGSLQVVSEMLLTLEPEQLRDEWTALALNARMACEEMMEQEFRLMQPFLEVLRGQED